MPRVKKLGRMDRREKEIRSRIGAIQGVLKVSQKQLAEMAGIPPATLYKRLGEDIGAMRLSELWAIEDLAKFNEAWPEMLDQKE